MSMFSSLGFRRYIPVVIFLCAGTVCFAGPDSGHWSFQELRVSEVPECGEANPIDAFLLQRLKKEGLGFAEQADSRTLLRRLSLDLIGLPPTPEEVAGFERALVENRDAAIFAAVERLLASPRYGERWGQHWLDAVRYADTHGFEVNTPRPNAWPYRDYVIRAFNEDLPYDRFILDQLAGDTTGEDAGTGFLVTAAALLPGQVGKDDDSMKRARQDELNEIVVNTATTFLGLTVHCARCHDHKFDPITQRDYYQLQAVFAGVRYGERPLRVGSGGRKSELVALGRQIEEHEGAMLALGFRLPVEARKNEERFSPVSARHVRFSIRRTNSVEPCIDELEVWSVAGDGEDAVNVALAARGVVATSSGDYNDPTKHRLAYINDGKFGNGRSWIAKQVEGGWVSLDFGKPILIDRITWGRDREGRYEDRLAIDYVIEVLDQKGGEWREVASSADRLTTLDSSELTGPQAAALRRYQELLASRARLSKQDKVFAGTFVKPPVSYLLNRGDATQPEGEVAPGALEIFGSLGLSSATSDIERRLALASWIASPENPLTARVIVNRVWHQHFGIGLVSTPSDFGAMGGVPSHPGLLDWLARRFVEDGWSIKKLQRLIVSSRAYQQSGRPRPDALKVDAGNRLVWRFRPRRLEAEAIRDSILQITGSLDLTMGGPGYSLFKPNTNYVRVYDPKVSFGPDEWRRMIYSHRVRMEQDGVFGVFDRPDAGLICSRRSQSTTPLQALNLFNSSFIQEQSELLAKRLESEGGAGVDGRIDRAFRLCFGRSAEASELAAGRDFVGQHGLAQFCRVLLNTNEFLFLP